jgi:hypothetical protein
MAKISLPSAVSGYNLGIINDNFDALEAELQDKVLYRDNPTGEPNQMKNSLDMNSNRILNLPAPSNPNEPARLQDVQDAIGNQATALLTTFTQNGVGAVERNVADKLHEFVSVLDFGADDSGATDSSAAFQDAYETGKVVWIPAGTYLLNSTVDCTTTSSSVFTPGPRFIGAGMGLVTINTTVEGPAFKVDTNTTLKFQLGGEFSGFKLQKSGSPAAAIGIQVRRAYQFLLEDLWIFGMSSDGIRVVMNEGDGDGSNMLIFRRVRIENCAGWGYNHAITGALNEISFIDMAHVFIQGCGTASASTPPPSGGMNYRGQFLRMENSAFTINENVALYIPGGAGLGNGVYMDSVAIENNKKRGIYCTGLSMFRAKNLHLYNNDGYTATVGIEFDGTSSAVRNIDIDGVFVRATAGNNPFTAFKIGGANALKDTCRVRRVTWDNFDYTGQTRFDGWQFDQINQDCALTVINNILVRLQPDPIRGVGNKTPLRLRGGGGGAPSTTGEWVPYEVTTNLNISNSGLANSTRYYCYVYDNSGTAALELSTTAPTILTGFGYNVKTGDGTRLYLGSVITNGSAEFVTSGTGWLNPTRITGSQLGADYFLWPDSTGDLRIKATAPTSDTDGTVVGTQS